MILPRITDYNDDKVQRILLVFDLMPRSLLAVARRCVAQSKKNKKAPRARIHFEILRIEKQFIYFCWSYWWFIILFFFAYIYLGLCKFKLLSIYFC